MSTAVENPMRRGQTIVVPAGAVVHSMNPRHGGRRRLAREMTVTLHDASPGYVQTWRDRDYPAGTVHLPQVLWAGSGGYWQRTQVTPELLAANGAEGLVLPELTKFERASAELDADDAGLPSLEDGYTTRWSPQQ